MEPTMTTLPRLVAALAVSMSAMVASAFAQGSISSLIVEGDPVPGVGTVTGIENLAINDPGAWIVELDTDNPNTDIDGALIKTGSLFLQEGQALAAPAGASIDSFDAVTLSAAGHSGWNFFLSGTTGTSDDSGIFFDGALVFQEGFISTAAAFTPGTPYIGFFETAINASNEILIVASIDDPAIASTVDRALVVATTDNAGTLLSEVVLAKEGDLLPGQVDTVADFGTGPHAFDFNEAGSVLFIADLNGLTTTDGCIYLDGTLLAQEGSPSPVAGRNWVSLSTSQRVALSNNGDTVYSGTLDGSTASDAVLIRNGALFRQEGDSLPAIAPFLLTSFGTSAPLDIDDGGNVLWFGDWDDPDTTRDTGLFLGDVLLVQEGVTLIEGQLVQSLSGVQDAYRISPNGRFVIFEATLVGGLNGAFLIDLCPEPTTYCTAKPSSIPGCVPAFITTGTPSASQGSGFQIDCGPVPGNNVGLFIYTTQGAAAVPVQNEFGFLCLGPGIFRLPASSGGGATGVCNGSYGVDFNTYFATQTADPSLVAGASVDCQVWYRDPPNSGGANLSGALHFLMCP
jgi:hypothetical protein